MRARFVRISFLLAAVSCAGSPPAPKGVPAPPPRAEGTTVVRATGGAFDPNDRDGDGVGDAYDLCATLLEDQRGEHPLDDAPEIEIVEVAGHADESGSDAANQRLTIQRSSAVTLTIIAGGVSRGRLRSSGYGAYCPAGGPRKDVPAEAGDRRVEFRILRRDGIDLEPRWGGCEAAAKHGMKPPSLPARKAAGRAGAAVDEAAECSDAAPKVCKARCDLGEAEACMIFAAALRGGGAVDPKSGRPDAQAALGALTKACDAGRLDACALAARAVRDGSGAPKDPKKALDLDARACVKGGALACADLGLALHEATGKLRDEAKSIEAHRRACELGDGGGCEALGARYWSGSGVKADRARAFDLFVAACEIGRSGCAALRDHVKDDPSAQQSRARALVALHVACEQDGDKDACGAITIMGEKPGEYSPAPLCSAGDFPACRAACGADPAGEACLGLGAALLYGMGVRRKPAEATVIFEQACQKESANGCAMSALLHESKASGARDLRVAADQYETACSKGEPSGCVNRARLQLEGLGTYRDEVAAATALDAACKQGIGIACARLASMTR